MKLATWNINSVRLRLPLVLQFLQEGILFQKKQPYRSMKLTRQYLLSCQPRYPIELDYFYSKFFLEFFLVLVGCSATNEFFCYFHIEK